MDRIEFDRVSKRYVLGERRNAREGLIAAARRAVGRSGQAPEEIWPLRDVSFTVGDGEALGIVGRNGAGKSTALKVLTQITTPTSGSSRTRGRVAALLEVGTGFHWELTGRENVYLSGVIHGMSRREVARAFDQIVDFAGVEPFLDTPVKRYSSGMYLRLAFAVAAHLDPDILVVDEILAVGDLEFQRKCLGRMAEAEQEGRTVVFVSHDLDTLSRLCKRSLWLEAGRIRHEGPSSAVVKQYLLSTAAGRKRGTPVAQSEQLTVQDVRVSPQAEPPDSPILQGESFRIEVDFLLRETVPGFDFTIIVSTESGVRLLDEALSDGECRPLSAGRYQATLDIPAMLNVGDFLVGLWFGTPYGDLLYAPAVAHFTVHGSDYGRQERLLTLGSPMHVTRQGDVVDERGEESPCSEGPATDLVR